MSTPLQRLETFCSECEMGEGRLYDQRKFAKDLRQLLSVTKQLRTAAKDMLSTYRHDDKTVLVTEERQEAWQKAINESETAS